MDPSPCKFTKLMSAYLIHSINQADIKECYNFANLQVFIFIAYN